MRPWSCELYLAIEWVKCWAFVRFIQRSAVVPAAVSTPCLIRDSHFHIGHVGHVIEGCALHINPNYCRRGRHRFRWRPRCRTRLTTSVLISQNTWPQQLYQASVDAFRITSHNQPYCHWLRTITVIIRYQPSRCTGDINNHLMRIHLVQDIVHPWPRHRISSHVIWDMKYAK